MNDPYILAARFFQGVAVLLCLGLVAAVILSIRDAWRAQRQADEHDAREIIKQLRREPVERPTVVEETAYTRDFRDRFTRHHLES